MSINIDKINFEKSDPEFMIKSIENFPHLCLDAWRKAKEMSLPSYYIKAKKFVLLGMGGSGIANNIIKEILFQNNIVIESVHDYDVPGWVNEDTVVIACSYSGDTEETLSAFIESHNLGAKLISITTGGKIKILSDKYKAPCFLFDYESKPRAAFPYLFVFLLSIFIKLGQIELSESEFMKVIQFVDLELQKFKANTHTSTNMAKSLAIKIGNKTPIICGSGLLKSVAVRFKSQLNENSKIFAIPEAFPELNHNAIEAINQSNKNFIIISLESNYDFARNIKRQNLTTELLRKNNIVYERIKLVPCESPLSEVLSMVLFGDFVSYYLSLLNKVDPSTNKNISFLKSQLDK